jgi:L-fucose isomerase-like protein
MKMFRKKTCFGVIVGTRGIFSSKLAEGDRKVLLKKLKTLGYDYVVLPESETPSGSIETREDAKKCAKFFVDHREKIDGILVNLPNFGDELGIVNTLDLAKPGLPVMVQASDDDPKKVSITERRDSFCGKFSVCNNLYQYSIPWTDTTNHTCDLAGQEFTADLDYFARVCRVVKGLKNARIGAIGARPGAFQTVRYSEKLLQASGITVVTVDLSEIIGAAQKMDDKAAAVRNRVKKNREYGKIPATIGEDKIIRNAKLCVAIDNWVEANEIDASAVQCWESIQRNYGCATCLAMSMMSNRLVPSACEVDVTGAVSMYALALASGNAPGFLDWNNNYGDNRNKCVNTHCSNFPKDFMGADIEISNLDVLGASLGVENSFGAIKGHVARGPMSFFRISTDDRFGEIKAYLGQGEFTSDPFPMDGGIAVCKVDNLRALLHYMLKNGFEHHVAMVRGHWQKVLQEAIGNYMGWDLYSHC